MLQAPDWWLLLLAGAIFTVALLGITQAYRIAVVIVVAPFVRWRAVGSGLTFYNLQEQQCQL